MPENEDATPALTREALTQAALRVLERDGLDGLSMRKVAAEVGVKAASLYWHVRNKQELLDLLSDAILASAEPPPRQDDWRAELYAYSASYRRLLLDNRDAARVVAGRLAPGPCLLNLMEDQLDRLRTAGFSDADTAMASYLLGAFVQGFVLQEQSPISAAEVLGTSRRDVADAAGDLFRGLPTDQYPNLSQLADHLTGPDMDARFDFCLNRVLDGLAALLPPERR
ncbi:MULTISPECIES: TetR/AcrR family transcriptional regulator C-terminal domain-containing protein [Kitasatospora]|uniref:TetR/AcrR family transcriptional regulator C-terminal domain-containing protein n=1 Tax=Kitasatospora cathayae TaxID=3004092 RepID=A0ABY7QDS9_9ACTN|nr:TetR/AcrR family transcriptional regulator C-terminal domain-containing protein [Kitasatospora sp. HUAS 3-15]WBP90701.1 TetR/AcrR family transcriptional regulator C-terminal domain-containing protein [Kitasatospora sp. HUAS 3-15]